MITKLEPLAGAQINYRHAYLHELPCSKNIESLDHTEVRSTMSDDHGECIRHNDIAFDGKNII